MAIRLKRKLRGADGGKHPHVKNAQDFEWKPPNYRRSLRRNARTALHLLAPTAVQAGLGDDVRWLTVKVALENLLESLKDGDA